MEYTCIIKFVINLTSTAIRMSGILRGHKKNFLHPLLKRHECPICLHAMRDPVQTECGHLFCKGCLEPILATPNPECPLDRSAIYADQVGVALLVHAHATTHMHLKSHAFALKSGFSGQRLQKGDPCSGGVL